MGTSTSRRIFQVVRRRVSSHCHVSVCSFQNSQTVHTTSGNSGLSSPEKGEIPDNDKRAVFRPLRASQRNLDGIFHQSVQTIGFFVLFEKVINQRCCARLESIPVCTWWTAIYGRVKKIWGFRHCNDKNAITTHLMNSPSIRQCHRRCLVLPAHFSGLLSNSIGWASGGYHFFFIRSSNQRATCVGVQLAINSFASHRLRSTPINGGQTVAWKSP